MPWKLELRLQTEPTAIRATRKAIASTMHAERMPDSDVVRAEIAVGEVLTNARRHAYGGGVGPLEVELEFDGAGFSILIHDHGRPLTAPLATPDALPVEPSGGRGLYLIRRLVDEVEIIRSGFGEGGVAIRLVKYLQKT